VQGRDLVVELLAALVEAARTVGQHLGERGFADFTALAFREFRRDFQQRERAAYIAIGGFGEFSSKLGFSVVAPTNRM
jgi:hypothetical protein